MKMKNFSLISVVLCTAALIYLILSTKYYKDDRLIIESDAVHYYSYLPSLLVFNDLSQSFLNKDIGVVKKYFWTKGTLPDGKYYFKTTMGVALMQSVFIVPIHYIVKWTGGIANGVSMPYRLGILLSALFYYFLGLYLIRYLLIRKYKFSEAIAGFTILGIGLATNITLYVFREPGMSHIYSFAGILLFTVLLDKFFESPTRKIAFLTGLAGGLVVLVRQVNLVVIVVLVLSWDVNNFAAFKERLRSFFNRPIFTILFLAGAILVWIPQFSYYYYLTGSIFFSGYGDETSRFYFSNPQIFNSLFSYKKGWFLYTPIMLLAVAGLIPLFFKFRKTFWSVLGVLLLMIYINSSWYSWWFGGGYGLRAYIDLYGLLAIPLAFFIRTIWSKYIVSGLLSGLLVLLFAFHNIFQSFQYINGSIHWSDMTKEAYLYSIGKLYPGMRLPVLLHSYDINSTKQGIYTEAQFKKKTKEEWLIYIQDRFKADPGMLNFLKEKAEKQNKSLEKVMYDDAQWFLKQDKALLFESAITQEEGK